MSKKRNVQNNRRKNPKNNTTKIEVQTARFTSGPLPSEERLQKYNEIDPSFANRIFLMAERDLQKAIWIAKAKTRMGFVITIFGLLCAVISVLGLLYIAYLCVINDLEDAIKWIFLSAAGIAGVFLIKKKRGG